MEKVELRAGHWPPSQNARVRRRVMRATKMTDEQLKQGEERGWEFWYSFRSMRGKVLARKDSDDEKVYGPIDDHNSLLELLVNDRIGYEG